MNLEPVSTNEEQAEREQSPAKRLAVVLQKSLAGGRAANVAAVVVGGLKCQAFGEPVKDLDGNRHAAIKWNMPVLRAKTNGQLLKLLNAASAMGVESVAFCDEGRSMSNSFVEYISVVTSHKTEHLSIVGVGLFGDDAAVRELTRQFSIYLE